MRVLLLATDYPPTVGGLPVYVQRLATGLARSGNVVDVVVRNTLSDPSAAELSRLASGGGVRVWWAPTWREVLPLIRGASVVHINGFWLIPALASLALRKATLWTHHEYDTSCPIGLGWYRGESTSFSPVRCGQCMAERGRSRHIPRRFLMLWVRNLVASRVHINLAPTRYVAERLALPRTRVVQHGVEQSEPNPDRLAEPARFAFVGRLSPIKGGAALVRAAAICRKAGIDELGIDFYGDGPERPFLEGLAADEGVDDIVSFHGSIESTAVPNAISQCTAVVVPSIWDEVAGLIALEAMAGGVPVIATRVGGLAEIVRGSGILVERESVTGLARAMERLSSDRAEVARLGAAGFRKWQERHTATRMVSEHEVLYQEIST